MLALLLTLALGQTSSPPIQVPPAPDKPSEPAKPQEPEKPKKTPLDLVVELRTIAAKFDDAWNPLMQSAAHAVTYAQGFPKTPEPKEDKAKKEWKDKKAQYEEGKRVLLRDLKRLKENQLKALLAVDLNALPDKARRAASDLVVSVRRDVGILDEVSSLVARTGTDRHTHYASAARLMSTMGSATHKALSTVKSLDDPT